MSEARKLSGTALKSAADPKGGRQDAENLRTEWIHPAHAGTGENRCYLPSNHKIGVSAEAEHRALLEEVLLRPKARPFAEVLASMPDVGEDADFTRVDERGRPDRVFD